MEPHIPLYPHNISYHLNYNSSLSTICRSSTSKASKTGAAAQAACATARMMMFSKWLPPKWKPVRMNWSPRTEENWPQWGFNNRKMKTGTHWHSIFFYGFSLPWLVARSVRMWHYVILMTRPAVFLSSFLGCSKKDVVRRRGYLYHVHNTSEYTWTTWYNISYMWYYVYIMHL